MSTNFESTIRYFSLNIGKKSNEEIFVQSINKDTSNKSWDAVLASALMTLNILKIWGSSNITPCGKKSNHSPQKKKTKERSLHFDLTSFYWLEVISCLLVTNGCFSSQLKLWFIYSNNKWNNKEINDVKEY